MPYDTTHIPLRDHAPEPWFTNGSVIRDRNGKVIGNTTGWSEENIHRLIASVNACSGYKDLQRRGDVTP